MSGRRLPANDEEREVLLAGLDALIAKLHMARVRRGKGSVLEPSHDPMESRQILVAEDLRDRVRRL